MRRNRADGHLVGDVPAYRRIMPYIMRSRTESAVLFEQELDLSGALRWLDDFNDRYTDRVAKPFDVILWAAAQTLNAWPKLNRFVAGGRLYQRDTIWISYSAKKEMSEDAPVFVIKRRFDPEESFADLVAANRAQLHSDRTATKSYTDRELDLVLKARGLPLRALVAVERCADAFGLLPRAYIDNDPLFASAFIANLGSLGMDAAYHHLYEYGTISVFATMGRVRTCEGRPQMVMRYTYDERVEDGFYAHSALEHLKTLVENPSAWAD